VTSIFLISGAARAASSFGPGEQMVLGVDYSGIRAGTTTVTVGAPTKVGTADAWPIVALANTESLFSLYPMHDKIVSWWDASSGHSVGWDFYLNENGHSRRERGKLNSPSSGKAQVQRVREGEPPSNNSYDIDPTAQDITAAFFVLRSKALKPGDDLTIPIFTGGRSWDMKVHVNDHEPLSVPAGKFDALPLEVEVHFQGKLESKRNLKVWVSNDDRHVLLQMVAELSLGSIHAELMEYHPGTVETASQ
jgi:hypothetical protein